MKMIGLGLVPPAGDLVSYLDALSESGTGRRRIWVCCAGGLPFERNVCNVPERAKSIFFRIKLCGCSARTNSWRQDGQRVHTGRTEPLNAQFARDFTKSFATLSQRYPVYAELDNLFRLAIVAAVLRREEFPQRTGWSLDDLLEDATVPVATGPRAEKRRVGRQLPGGGPTIFPGGGQRRCDVSFRRSVSRTASTRGRPQKR